MRGTHSSHEMWNLVRIAIFVALVPALTAAQYYPYGASPHPGSYKGVAGSFHGKLKDLSSKEITIETGDDQIVSIHRNHKTKFFKGTESIKPTDIEIGTPVTVDAIEEVDLSLTARSVTVDTPKKKGEGDK
jgi:hypothetical protein